MSLEDSIDKLAEAILVHAKALTALSGAAPAATDTPAAEPKEDGSRVAYWANKDGTYGKCSVAEYKKMSKGDDDYSLIDPDEFKARTQASKKLQEDNAAAAKKAQKVKDDAAAKKAAEKKDAAGDITDEELGGLVKPFAGVDTPKERTRRVNWLKEVFAKFGVAKASELDQEQRPEFVALVKAAQAAVEDDEGADLPDLDSAGGGDQDDALV
ncbi:MAG: hypothetical protein ACREA9_29740 [Pyrinomonadaceae bacterium]